MTTIIKRVIAQLSQFEQGQEFTSEPFIQIIADCGGKYTGLSSTMREMVNKGHIIDTGRREPRLQGGSARIIYMLASEKVTPARKKVSRKMSPFGALIKSQLVDCHA